MLIRLTQIVSESQVRYLRFITSADAEGRRRRQTERPLLFNMISADPALNPDLILLRELSELLQLGSKLVQAIVLRMEEIPVLFHRDFFWRKWTWFS